MYTFRDPFETVFDTTPHRFLSELKPLCKQFFETKNSRTFVQRNNVEIHAVATLKFRGRK